MKKHNTRGYCMKNNDGANSRINWGALRDVQLIEAGAAPDQRKAFAFIAGRWPKKEFNPVCPDA